MFQINVPDGFGYKLAEVSEKEFYEHFDEGMPKPVPKLFTSILDEYEEQYLRQGNISNCV